MKKTIYERAVEKWGIASQLDMVVEECAELIKAVIKAKRHINGNSPLEVAEEIADVEVMIKQLECIFEGSIAGSPFYRDYIEHRKKEKLKRIENILKNDG